MVYVSVCMQVKLDIQIIVSHWVCADVEHNEICFGFDLITFWCHDKLLLADVYHVIKMTLSV